MTKLKTSAERVANLLEKFPDSAQQIVDKTYYCEHVYVVVSKKLSPTSEHATQVMCQRCCLLMDFKGIAQVNEDIKGLLNTMSPTGVSQTSDDS